MKCALVGLGMVADTHLAAIQAIDGLDLAGVLSRDRSRAGAFQEKAARALNRPVDLYSDLSDLKGDSTIDFVILATPPDARAEFADAFVQAKKPILMEKPIERTYDAARQIVETCEAGGVPLGVVFQIRMRESSLKLRQLVNSGALGTIETVDIRVPWWRPQSYYDTAGRGSFARDGGGVVITQAIHTLDLALWIAGPVCDVQALMHRTSLHRLEAEDWAGALMRFSSGAVGSFAATTAAYPGSTESLKIQGSKAHAALSGGALRVDYLDGNSETFGTEASTGGGADPMAFSHAWHQAIIEDFMRCIAGGTTPVAHGRSALAVHAVIDAMTRASQSNTLTKVYSS